MRGPSDTAIPVEVWAFDEHRLGLKPFLRKVWAPRGCRPTASGHHRYQWLYLYGFVRPATGEVVWFIADGVNTALFSALLILPMMNVARRVFGRTEPDRVALAFRERMT